MEKRSPHVGHCIYCGETEGPLSDEHTVPYSLGGTAVLRNASCPSCAEITSRFELDIARFQLGAFRVRAHLPTRHPKERPKTLSLELLNKDGSRRILKVDPYEHPSTLMLPDLPEPFLLEPTLIGPRRPFRMFVAFADSDVLELPRKHNAVAMGIGSFDIGSFYLLLAKVAHAGAYYYPGNWSRLWEPLLPDLILGKTEDYDRLIGGTGNPEFAPSDGSFPMFYRTVEVGNEMYLVAFFRLFGQNDTPTYQVVVGQRRPQVTTAVLRQIHPDGLSALAVDQDKVGALLNNLDAGNHQIRPRTSEKGNSP